MKTKILSVSSILVIIAVVAVSILTGCSSKATTTTTTSAATTPATTSTTPAVAKTLKIGNVNWLGWSLGLDSNRGTQVAVDMINAKGGLTIGNSTYQLQLISYDSNFDQATEVAAINRLVYQDKVSFILGFPMFISADLPITEANKIVFLASSSDMSTQFSSNNKYTACPDFINPPLTVSIGWFHNHYPQVKTYASFFSDDTNGHFVSNIDISTMKAFGLDANYTTLFYPPNTADFSTIGTKIAQLNPDCFIPSGGSDQEGKEVAAVRAAGYKGIVFIGNPITYQSLSANIPADAIPGIITLNDATEFNPPSTQTANDFKDAYIAKYGKWDVSDPGPIGAIYCLVTALQQAGSTDVDKVNSIIQSGLKFSAPAGDGMMIARPDYSNSRTVDSISDIYMVQYDTGGQTKLLEKISANDALTFFQQAFPGK